MAQTGYTPIQLYNSATPSAAPTAGNLATGELALNIADGKLFYKDSGGVVQVLATKGAGTIGGSDTQVQYNSSGALAGSANLTFNGTLLTAAEATVTGATTFSATTQNLALGTSQTSGTWTAGGAAQTGAMTLDQSTKTHTLSIGTGATENAATKTINFGTGGVSGSTTAITIGSTNGTTTTLNGTVTAATFNSTTIDTTNIEVTNVKAKDGTSAATIADSTGVVSFTANPVMSGGTANGVTYLNGSKVLTSGSALTFDGTNFATTGYVHGRSGGTSGEAFRIGNDATLQDINAANTFGVYGVSDPTTGAIKLGSAGPTVSGVGTTLDVDGALNLKATGGEGGQLTLQNTTNTGGVYNFDVDSSNNGRLFTTVNNTNLSIGQLSGTGGNVLFFANGGEGMRLTSTGLGIGTSSPGNKLHVDAVSLAPTSGAVARFDTTATTAYNSGAFVGGQLRLNYGNATSSYSGINFSNFGATSQEFFGVVQNSSGYGNFVWQGFNGTYGERMRLDSSGNLGLGTQPSGWATYKAVQVGWSSIAGYAANDLGIFSNAYFDGGYKYIGSGNATQYRAINGTHQFFTAPSGTAGNAISFTQAMTLDASGNLLVGTTSASIGASGRGVIEVNGTSDSVFASKVNGTLAAVSGLVSATEAIYGSVTNIPMVFRTNNTERARITSGGDLLVGTTTSAGKLTVEQTGSNANGAFITNQTYNYQTLGLHNTATANDNLWVTFGTEASITTRGSIDYNRAGGLTRYNTTSDYRAKDIIGPIQNPGATIDALKVYEGQMKGATQPRPMLVAHEAQEHAPYAVSGVKDEVNEDGTPKFQQMDVSSLVPLLIAEIQSLRARVAALEA